MAYRIPPDRRPADDPLPRRRLLSTPPLGGVIKERASDFLVDEIPVYEPSGEGEHLYLGVQKENMPHTEMIEILRRHYGVGEEAIGFAGMKDKVAVTRQTVSVHLPGKAAPTAAPEHERMQVLWQVRHLNKLRRGHLKANRFSIRIRKIDPLKAPEIWRALRTLEKSGIPDYYGAQRFGYRRNTHRLGRHLVHRDAPGFLRELLGTVSEFPAHQAEQRGHFEAGRYAESIPLWGRNDRAERAALVALAKGRSPEQAVNAIPAHVRMFWVSALQSAVFNRVLDRRLEDGLLTTMIDGDVAYLHGSRGQFTVGPDELAADDLQRRVERFEISPSGPMFGPGMIQARGQVAEWERTAARELGTDPDTLGTRLPGALASDGTRRPFRVPVSAIELEGGFDEFGPYVRLAFDLPRGAYATVLLREILGDESGDDEDAPRE